jgi:hypothetical protein
MGRADHPIQAGLYSKMDEVLALMMLGSFDLLLAPEVLVIEQW